MFKKQPLCTLERICANDSVSDASHHYFDCWVPPVGYGFNTVTGSIEKTDVLKKSQNKKEQFWEIQALSKDYDKKRILERARQEKDGKYFDNDLERYRLQEWGRRIRGVWFYNNGEPTYVTGLHYFYLNWWSFQGKKMEYRNTDRKFFYVLEFCVQDPLSLGLIEVTKRKQGKTARAGVFLYEYISRNNAKHGGIQSKTSGDAQEVFAKAIIAAWKKLPHFFRPVYDYKAGDPPKRELRFFRPATTGKAALDVDPNEKELESWIDFKSSETDAYDGPELHRYVSDEAGKLKDVSIYERHEVVQFCSDVEGQYVGKQLYTTTVEEMQSGGGEFKKLWDDSDPKKRNANGRTTTGLYRYFLPSYETLYYDKYGFPDEGKAKVFFLNERDGKNHDTRAKSAIIRKNPFTIKEAFRVDGDKCMFDSEKLNNRRDTLSYMDVTERGNFEWNDKDDKTKGAYWKKQKNGRAELCKGFAFDDESHQNNVYHSNGFFKPLNKSLYVAGCDPYDHNQTQDNRKSMGCLYVKKRHVPGGESNPFNDAFVLRYNARPSNAGLLYDDFLKICYYFGCELLFESNKPGIGKYFTDNGFEKFLVILPGYKEPGIPSTVPNKQVLAEKTETHIDECIDKVYFIKLIDDWLEFDLNETQKFDDAMAAGWTEVADKYRLVPKRKKQRTDITKIFSLRKVA